MTEPVGQEPDPRFSLANERTFLAWVRTMLAVLAGAVALESLDIPDGGTVRHVLVIGLLVLAGTSTLAAYRRWQRIERSLRLGEPLPPFVMGRLVAIAMAVTAAVLVVIVVTADL